MKVDLHELAGLVAAEESLSVDMLRGRHRHRRLSAARNLFVATARRANVTYKEIGSFLGRDHSTIAQNLGLWTDRMAEEDTMAVERLFNAWQSKPHRPRVGSVWMDERGNVLTCLGYIDGKAVWTCDFEPDLEASICLFRGHVDAP